MTETWFLATLWIGLALIATLLSIWMRIATALSEIVVGTVAQLIIGALFSSAMLNPDTNWIKFLSGTGAIMLTFLAGAELDPEVLKKDWKKAGIIGMAGFIAPFLGCTAIAFYLLHWTGHSSWLAGVALSTTSVAVVYAVMLEFGLNKTQYGKLILAACFVNDLATVIALGLIFAPFTYKTAIFVVTSIVLFSVLPWITPRFFKKFGNRPSELEAKYLLLLLFGFGALATWAQSEAVLPAYMIGMVLAGTVGKDHALVRRLRTLTFGLLTPFYFIRAGSFVSISAIIRAPLVVLALLFGKMATKSIFVYPAAKISGNSHKEGMYTTMLMSTGLTFGSISALFGFTHGIITKDQYSFLIVAVVLSAVVPTLIANAFYLPKHLLAHQAATEPEEKSQIVIVNPPAPAERSMS